MIAAQTVGKRRSSTVTNGFTDSFDHILAEFERIDILMQSFVAQARSIQQVDALFQGLYISETEVDGILGSNIGLPEWATDKKPEPNIGEILAKY